MKLLLISHLGLGDSLNINGAIRYFTSFYSEVYIIAKPHYFDNVSKIYSDISNLKVLKGYDDDIPRIYTEFPEDIINIGLNSSYKNRVKNNDILLQQNNRNSFAIHFLSQMYRNALLDLNIYNNYYELQSTSKSKELYDSIKSYYIIFVHEEASNNFVNLKHKFDLLNTNQIVICSNRNYYESNDNRFNLANAFVGINIIDYYDTVINASEIHISDSCFSSMTLPLVNNGIIKTDKLFMYPRKDHLDIDTICNKFTYIY